MINAAELRPDEIANVLAAYQFPIQYWPHRSVYFINTNGPEYILKPLKVGAIQAYLTGLLLSKQARCSIIPRLVKPVSGGFYLWYRGNRYLVIEKLLGRSADYFSIKDLQAAIIAMSSFHRFGKELLNMPDQPWLRIKFQPAQIWRKRLQEMENCREMAIRDQDDPLSREYLQKWHQAYGLAFRAIQEFAFLPETIPKVICYHDWAYHNVLIHQGEASLIDFDEIIVDHPVHDRVNLISRYLRLHHWSIESLLKILWNFDRYYQWEKGDLKRLRIYLTFPYEYWMFGRQYLIEKQPWSRSYFKDQWLRKVGTSKQREKLVNLIEKME